MYCDIAEEIRRYEGAIWAQSHHMGHSFKQFSDDIEAITRSALGKACAEPRVTLAKADIDPQPPPESYDVPCARYLLDAREHSAIRPLTKRKARDRIEEEIQRHENDLQSAWRERYATGTIRKDFSEWMSDRQGALKSMTGHEALNRSCG